MELRKEAINVERTVELYFGILVKAKALIVALQREQKVIDVHLEALGCQLNVGAKASLDITLGIAQKPGKIRLHADIHHTFVLEVHDASDQKKAQTQGAQPVVEDVERLLDGVIARLVIKLRQKRRIPIVDQTDEALAVGQARQLSQKVMQISLLLVGLNFLRRKASFLVGAPQLTD